jgi:hypothetical protein
MKAGRELDALVAEKVMGWRPTHGMLHGKEQDLFVDSNGNTHGIECGCIEDFHPSTNISDAWKVVEKLKHCAEGFAVIKLNPDRNKARYQAGIQYDDGEGGPMFMYDASATADTAAMAICLAALKAVSL